MSAVFAQMRSVPVFALLRGVLPGLVALAVLVSAAGAQDPCADEVVVSPGESLGQIAQRCGIPLGALLAANPGLSDPDVVQPGTRLAMPDVERARARVDGHVESRAGETLAAVAARHGLPLALLNVANPEIGTGVLEPGTRIVLPR